jgi:AraC family transcriptional regulator of adaptative response/methylated-DNA-[protein]-cysteine methyltransferase
MDRTDYIRIASAIRYLADHAGDQPSLADVAGQVGLSEHHFQRLFSRWVGISPKRFLQFQTLEHAKAMLRDSRPVLETAYGAGLSGGGRLHDLFVTLEAVTPGEYKAGGRGLDIRAGFHATPFGECLLATTSRGVCGLSFDTAGRDTLLADLEDRWPGARVLIDDGATAPVAERIFGRFDGDGWTRDPLASARPAPLPVLVRGTNFQVRVWEALLRIPAGSVATYESIADQVCTPAATRAVGNAVGRNPVAYLIPCHRVIRKTGVFGNYRWGAERKVAMLMAEEAKAVA